MIRDHSAVSPASSKQDARDYVPPCLAYVDAGTAIPRTIASPRRILHGPASSTGSHADRCPAHLTYVPARGLDLALRANTDGDMDLDTASVKTAPGPSLPIVSTRSRAPLSHTPPAPRGSSPHASESRAHVSASGMGSSLNENAHVREMRAQTLNRPQDPAQRHTHTLNGIQHGLGYKNTPWGNKDGTDSLGAVQTTSPGSAPKNELPQRCCFHKTAPNPLLKTPSVSLLRRPLHHHGTSWVRRRHFDRALSTTAGAGEEAGDHARTRSAMAMSLLLSSDGFFHWVIRPSKNGWLGSGFRVNARFDQYVWFKAGFESCHAPATDGSASLSLYLSRTSLPVSHGWRGWYPHGRPVGDAFLWPCGAGVRLLVRGFVEPLNELIRQLSPLHSMERVSLIEAEFS
ncbi:hypothetical protein JB92DRAFT_2838567 [Gautieria morchelliformis]|nr:hypothetical protein JB92DRAFT_2838567 [Gautieria morchelliformis]